MLSETDRQIVSSCPISANILNLTQFPPSVSLKYVQVIKYTIRYDTIQYTTTLTATPRVQEY